MRPGDGARDLDGGGAFHVGDGEVEVACGAALHAQQVNVATHEPTPDEGDYTHLEEERLLAGLEGAG